MNHNIPHTMTRSVDKKGRLLLGAELADSTVLVERTKKGEFIIRPAVTVPVEEAWLFRNKKALDSVLSGLEDARMGRVVEDPRRGKKSRSRKSKG